MAKPPGISDILGNFERGEARTYTLELPNGLKINAKGAIDHARAMEALEKIGVLAAYDPAATPAVRPQGLKRISLVEASAKWEKAIKNTDPKTIGAKKRAINDLLEWKQGEINAHAVEIGGEGATGAPVWVDEIDSTTCGDWFIHLKSQLKKDKETGKEILRYSPGTMENKFIYAGGFFEWAMTNGFYPKGDAPTMGHANVPKKVKRARAKSHGAQAFDPEHIDVMFQPENLRKMRSLAARWAPLLLLYTGARSNEIGRLELADIYEWPKKCEPGTGTKVFEFTRVGDDKSLKTDESERRTPIHPHLIELGFWGYVERMKAAQKTALEQVKSAKRSKAAVKDLEALKAAEQEARKLFPMLTFGAQNGPANAPQSAFRRMLKEAGIEARGNGTVGHHSFRDTVIDKMKQAGVAEEVRQEYTGHEHGDSENSDAYEQRFSPPALAKKCHPALEWGLDLHAIKQLLA